MGRPTDPQGLAAAQRRQRDRDHGVDPERLARAAQHPGTATPGNAPNAGKQFYPALTPKEMTAALFARIRTDHAEQDHRSAVDHLRDVIEDLTVMQSDLEAREDLSAIRRDLEVLEVTLRVAVALLEARTP